MTLLALPRACWGAFIAGAALAFTPYILARDILARDILARVVHVLSAAPAPAGHAA